MKITALGHAGFLFDDGTRLIIDPFLTGNPTAPFQASHLTRMDVVLVTHSHAAAATADFVLNLTKDGLYPVKSERNE